MMMQNVHRSRQEQPTMIANLDRFPRDVHLEDGTTLTLRPLQDGDTPSLMALFAQVSEEELRSIRDNVQEEAILRRWVDERDFERVFPIVAVLPEDGRFLGEISLHRHPGTPRANVGEMRMYVHPDYRRLGLGSILINEVIELGRDVGLEQLVVELFLEDSSMISAFERRGFEREAILSVYQLIVMRYDLQRRPGREVLEIRNASHLPARPLWPDLVFGDERLLPIPEMLNLSQMLDEIVDKGWGDRPAIRYRNETVTYKLLLSEVQRLASNFARLGIEPGDGVILHLPNTPQAIAINFAVQRVGAFSIPTVPLFSQRELAVVATESDAKAAVTVPALLNELLAVRERDDNPIGPIIVQDSRETDAAQQIYGYNALVSRGDTTFAPVMRRREEVGLLLYTSGDGGRPRGTAHRLDGIMAVVQSFGRYAWRINEEDVVGALSPLGFAQGFITFGFLPFRYGASVALPNDPMARDGEHLLETIRKHRVTLLVASPITYREILADRSVDELDIASLRLCASSGEPLTRDTYAAWMDRFAQPIFEGFGTTEMLYAFLSNAVGMSPRAGSLGQAVPGYEIKIVGDMGQELAEGEIGFLAVRGPTGTLYWNAEEAQRKSVRNGWNLLNDYAYRDRDDYFWYVARSDDLIKTRSYRIDPVEVERVISEHPNVAEVAVIGLPDEMRGQRPVAYVVPSEREEPGEQLRRSILSSLRVRLAEYKIPSEVIFSEGLPRNTSGQVNRRALRERTRQQMSH